MNAATDRRTVLGSILTAGACLSVASWSQGSAFVSDPVLAAIERHQRAYDTFMDVWGQTHGAVRSTTARRPTKLRLPSCNTSASSRPQRRMPSTLSWRRGRRRRSERIACLKHVADCGLATAEVRAWLAMLAESPLVA
jgi:hypothetical protein